MRLRKGLVVSLVCVIAGSALWAAPTAAADDGDIAEARVLHRGCSADNPFQSPDVTVGNLHSEITTPDQIRRYWSEVRLPWIVEMTFPVTSICWHAYQVRRVGSTRWEDKLRYSSVDPPTRLNYEAWGCENNHPTFSVSTGWTSFRKNNRSRHVVMQQLRCVVSTGPVLLRQQLLEIRVTRSYKVSINPLLGLGEAESLTWPRERTKAEVTICGLGQLADLGCKPTGYVPIDVGWLYQ